MHYTTYALIILCGREHINILNYLCAISDSCSVTKTSLCLSSDDKIMMMWWWRLGPKQCLNFKPILGLLSKNLKSFQGWKNGNQRNAIRWKKLQDVNKRNFELPLSFSIPFQWPQIFIVFPKIKVNPQNRENGY